MNKRMLLGIVIGAEVVIVIAWLLGFDVWPF
jgi:hypothetical protein